MIDPPRSRRAQLREILDLARSTRADLRRLRSALRNVLPTRRLRTIPRPSREPERALLALDG